MKFQFTHPEWLLLLPVAWAWILWLALKSDVQIGAWRRWMAAGLRFVVALLLVLAIAGVQWMKPLEGVNVFFLLDRSDSIPSPQQEAARKMVNKFAGEMSYPYDVRVDAAGLRFVCEFGNSRIQVFDSKNQPVEIIGGPGAEPGQFNNPWSIALDSHGTLYVADALNHRVQKLVRRRSVVSGPLSVASSQAHNSSRRDATKIARRFNAGTVVLC